MEGEVACPDKCETQRASIHDCSSNCGNSVNPVKDCMCAEFDAGHFLRTCVYLGSLIDWNNFLPLDSIILEPMEAKRKIYLQFIRSFAIHVSTNYFCRLSYNCSATLPLSPKRYN
jgi:hypothetical protein